MTWKTLERPGYFGKKRDAYHANMNQQYGDQWRIAYQWGDQTISRDMAIHLYEDAYLVHLQQNPAVLEWLVNTASEVYDNALTNVDSKLDYSIQEASSNHLQDISLRRCLVRLGETFQGDHLVEIRSKSSEGAHLSPGAVPFHMQEMIVQPAIQGWWEPNTIEDFYQSNKIVQIYET